MKEQLFETSFVKADILESDSAKLPKGVLCQGVWPICNIGKLNHNNRMYEKDVYERVIANALITEKMKNRTLYGEPEHPQETQSSLDRTSHIVTDMWIDEKTDRVMNRIEVLNTPGGQLINTLLEAGCLVGVSTRAEGELEEVREGQKEPYMRVVPESYNYVTTDFTADPSTLGAIPVQVEKNVVNQVQEALKEGKVDKRFACSLLESCKSKEAKTLLETVQEKEEPTEKEPTNEKDESPWRKLKVGDKVKYEGKEYSVKGISLEESTVDISTDDGTVVSVNDPDSLVVITPPDGSAVPVTDEPPSSPPVDLEDVVPPGPDIDVAMEPPGVPEEDLEAELEPEGPSGPEALGLDLEEPEEVPELEEEPEEEEEDEEEMNDSKKASSGDDKLDETDDQKAKESKTPASDLTKEILSNKIDKALAEAQRDKAVEVASEIEEQRVKEIAILTKKLNALREELKPEDRSVLDQALAENEALQKKIQEMKKQAKLLMEKISKIKESFAAQLSTVKEGVVKMEADFKKKLEEEKKRLAEEAHQVFMERYAKYKIETSGLPVTEKVRTLIESCDTPEEADELVEHVRDTLRESALHSEKLESVDVDAMKENSGQVYIDKVVGDFMDAMI